MSKEALKGLRIFIPGIIILLFAITVKSPNIQIDQLIEEASWLDTTLFTGMVIILGAIYYIFNFRKWFLLPSLKKIHDNIKKKLLISFKDNQEIQNYKNKLKEGKILIECFYSLVDNNETLKEKAKNVHLNGLIWSSIADLSTLSVAAALIHFTLFVFSKEIIYFYWAIGYSLLLSISSTLLMNLITNKHIEMSNDQLDFINQMLKDELQKTIEKTIKYLDGKNGKI